MASVNEYERARNERILANESKMRTLNIKNVAVELKSKPIVAAAQQNEGKVAPVYITASDPKETPVKTARTSRATGKGPIRHNVDPEKFPYATPAAIQQAQEAAEALADELNEKAGEIIASAKGMRVSHVSGGFWLQNPRAVTDCFGPTTTSHRIELECFESCRHKKCYEHTVMGSQTRWGVQYLPRPGGHSGMSGGWIYFAIDHALTPNDSVVMEVVANQGPKFVRMHIIRAKLQMEA